MRALHDIRAEMQDTCADLTHPREQASIAPARIVRSRHLGDDDEGDTHIEPWMEIAFRGLTHASETGEPYALISCFMNGQPAALIAATRPDGDGMHVLPLFMAVQQGMTFTPHISEEAQDEAA